MTVRLTRPSSSQAVTHSLALTANEVVIAANRIAGVAVRTPLIESTALNERINGRAFIKFEGFQIGGSFKFRGAYNRLVQLTERERRGGVVAWSSGNHAQGVAAAARILGIKATIVMPADAPAIKVTNTRSLGAEIIFYDRATESREDIARGIACDRNAVLVPSYDDPAIIAGQGTVGLEIAQQAEALGIELDQVLVCCGGGGLVAGIATALYNRSSAKVYTVEPEGFDDTARSLSAGVRQSNSAGAASICDALLAPEPGQLTFPINQRLVTGGLVVNDDEVREAMRYSFETLKIVVEPGGAVALAAVLSGKIEASGGATAIVVSGSNVDASLFAKVL